MRALILGAGASKAAGYPLAHELLVEVGQAAEASASVQLRQSWEEWEHFRDSLPSFLSIVTHNPNPEVVFSLPDLFLLAIESEDTHRTKAAIEAWKAGLEPDGLELADDFESHEHEGLVQALIAKTRLMSVLEHYFLWKHHTDRDQREPRQYLADLLGTLVEGDAVITLNWDTLAERTLAEAELWNPVDGYGFPRSLALRGPLDDRLPLPESFPVRSPVKVLKLHGSFGWRIPSDDVIYLDSTLLLREFGFYFAGDFLDLVDHAEPEFAPDDPSLIAFPSFLKRFDHPTIDEVWRQAAAVLISAERVDVWGYSLPSSDGAFRSLLQPLATRVRASEASVVVHDPDGAARSRWGILLGDNSELLDERLGPSMALG